jgi:hypothetical protein
MHLNRRQFDVAIPGTWLTVLLIAAFISLPLTIPIAVVGAFVVGILFAIRDGGEGHD